jgi:hypothetical protein
MHVTFASETNIKDRSLDMLFLGKDHMDTRTSACTVKRECGNTDRVVHINLVTQGLSVADKYVSSSDRREATHITHQNKSGERA